MNIKSRRRRFLLGIIYFCTMFIIKNVAATSSLQCRLLSNTAFVSSLSQRTLSPYKCKSHTTSHTKYFNNGLHHVPLNRIPNINKRRCTSSSHMSSTSSDEMTVNEQQMKIDALKIVNEAIRAVDPGVAIRDRLILEEDNKLIAKDTTRKVVYDLSDYDNIRIISFGKASAAMALATADIISKSQSQERVPKIDGIVIIKDDHATDEQMKLLTKYNILVRSASHPIPDSRSVEAANEIIELVSLSCSRTLVIACISGGGSSLFCSPRDELQLEDLMSTNSRLLESGMPIEKMNIIRKRLEKGKGGRLAALAYPATVLSLVLSDIIGDPLELIASGPTVPDSSCWEDALQLVEEYGLNADGAHALPSSVLDLLQIGAAGKLDDTPSSSHRAFLTMGASDDDMQQSTEKDQKLFSETILVGNNDASVMAAAQEAENRGYNPVILESRFDGEAATVAGTYVSMAEMLSRQRNATRHDSDKYQVAPLPTALIAGGETVVTLPPKCQGKGGRNQELALSAALKMHDMNLRDVVLTSVGTDGTDGPQMLQEALFMEAW